MRRPSPRAPIAAVALGVLAACGGSSTSSGSSASSSSDEQTRTAVQVYDDMQAAMRQVDHVHIVFSVTDSTGTFDAVADVTQSSARVDGKQGGSEIKVVVARGSAFVSQDGGAFRPVPAALQQVAQTYTIAKGLDCATAEHGTLTKGPVSTVKGVRVIAVMDDGKAPGGAPRTYYISLSGPPRLVEAKRQGPTTPGGKPSCGHTTDESTTSATYDYSYDTPSPVITAPATTAQST